MTYHEEGMVGSGADNANLDAILGIPLEHIKMRIWG